ncbi:putative LPS assembly protein LptD [Christiangramia salexigens]|uniref:Organic solvent tolerance protein OstA n=1 Tax=Christiangramia salexigens TaxID=1913577 RepID=A0A1L3J329_9FLAO|nr:putative LPS assembly protein LptD [Christiangramia salexigens]APG59526.1 organic solvent tolerance protein OstA [Christiangramia salexigens]
MQTNIPNSLFCLVFTLLFSVVLYPQEVETSSIPVRAEKDTILSSMNSPVRSVDLKPQDSIKKDSVRPPQFLTDVVKYTAKDYMRLSPGENKMYLYNEAKIDYGDMTITAGLIIIDNLKNEVYAYGIKDSVGEYSQKPVFTQAQRTIEPDSIRFNFDSERALVYNSRTQEAEFNVKGEVTKRENDSVYFMKNVKFTTSKDVDNPEYYFYARRIKFVPDKKIVSGLVNMYIADVPTPLGLPFGYFPLTEEETSGFIIPSFGDSQYGYNLQNGGYYFAISDYIDLLALGSYYTNGSYNMEMTSNYAWRYRFRGNFSVRYEKLFNSQRGFPDFSERSNYNIRWTHSQDSKANPSSRFSASVNLGSSEYYQETINQSNTGNFLNNTLSSSVSYSKTFEGEPQINLSLAARHSQNTRTQTINMSLPTLQLSMSRIYPFAPSVGAKEGIFENINFQYSLRAENQIQTTDSLFFKPEMFRDAKLGAQHSIPISTNFKLFKFLSVSTNTSFEETWVSKTFERSYDPVEQEVVVDTISGFDSYRTYNFNASIGTTIYGLKNFGKNKKIQAIRHVMRPSISYGINPGFDRFYDTYERDDPSTIDEIELIDYSRFDGTLYGAPGKNFSSSIGLSLSNTFEAKVTSKDSTATEPKKITLLNNFSVSTSYNLAGDSLKLSPISMRGSIPIVKNKLDINFGGNLDVYALNNNNRRIDKLNIENGGSLFRLTSGTVNFGYAFSNKDFEGGNQEETDELENETFRNGGRPDDLFGKGMGPDDQLFEEDPFEKKETENESSWYNYKIPWDVRLAYSLNYTNSARQNEISAHSIMFNGNVELSPKWKVGVNSGYDVVNQGFTYTQFRFQRDLESWTMSFNWVPFGNRKQWNFLIRIKSSALSDIKYEKRRERDRQL